MSLENILRKVLSNSVTSINNFQIGLERECLRVDKSGALKSSPHPKALGSALTHPLIKTDFAEAQLELVTPPFSSIDESLKVLEDLQRFFYDHVAEYLWPLSMPCLLPENFDIAKFGSSKQGYIKTLYREGLKHRYGQNMQAISGVHINLSFDNQFLEFLKKQSGSKDSFQNFKNNILFKAQRNFIYEGWLLSYLFGAAPNCHDTYNMGEKISFPKATSLRMSSCGYYNKTQCQDSVSFASINTYVKDLEKLCKKPCHIFEAIGLYKNNQRIQLNTNVFQIENEHYSRIRPKPKPSKDLSSMESLKKYGLEYLEIRSIDLDPFSKVGITKETILFTYLFLLYCLLEKEPDNLLDYSHLFLENQDLVAKEGLKDNLTLKAIKGKIQLKSWSLEIFSKLETIATVIDDLTGTSQYSNVVANEKKKLFDKKLLPSFRLKETLSKDYLKGSMALCFDHKNKILNETVSSTKTNDLKRMAKQSLEKQQALEKQEIEEGQNNLLEGSTKLLLKECLYQNLSFTILDERSSLIQVSNGKKSCIIKQATITEKDNLLCGELLLDKNLTKNFLNSFKLSTPKAVQLHQFPKDLSFLKNFHSDQIVIKPSKTNYGIGIAFTSSVDTTNILKAIKNALKLSETVLVEEFIEGPEYRFLVIDNQITAILKRIPANIVGDGQATIQELVEKKNQTKNLKESILFGPFELENLKKQDLSLESILPKNKQVFLRKNSNISTGGDAIGVTNTVPDFFQSIALKACKKLNVFIGGVDMIIPSLTNRDYSILEINHNPHLLMHYNVYSGEKVNPATHVLRALKLLESVN